MSCDKQNVIEPSSDPVDLLREDRSLVRLNPYSRMVEGQNDYHGNEKMVTISLIRKDNNDHDTDQDEGEDIVFNTLIDHSWCSKILRLVGHKMKLMESFSLLSTIGGGFSALGERDRDFSLRAGSLSLGQQLRLADLLGDERLKVMCHLFAVLAALQLGNKQFCIHYIKRVIVPMICALPHCDPIINNILGHICFRLRTLEIYKSSANAIKSKEENDI